MLCLSLKTVHNNLSVIRTKLGARTDAHLVWIALGAGLVSLSEGLPSRE
jgi:DNA-binding NarL/FixJ family response regulator